MRNLVAGKPVLALGGMENAVSIVRSLGKQGATVFVSSTPNCVASYSRFGNDRDGLTVTGDTDAHWRKLLLDEPHKDISGAIILALSDSAISFIAKFEDQLKLRYSLERNQAQLRARLLDKLETLQLAEKAGLDVPKTFEVSRDTDIHATLSKARYPILVKPIYSHLFREKFGVKLYLANSAEEAATIVSKAHDHRLDVMLCEWIPGLDDQLCSYYTYVDSSGKRLVEFTKTVSRREPQYFGGGVFHGASWQPDVAEAGRRFVSSTGMSGICNIEFKRDPRDDSLKVIESNPRITAAQELLVRSGLDLAELTYRDLTNQDIQVRNGEHYRYGHTLWYPRQDFSVFRAMLKKKEITWWEWIGQVSRWHVYPYFRFDDPMPAITRALRKIRRRIRKGFKMNVSRVEL